MHPFIIFMIVWAISILITLWMIYYIATNVITDFARNGLLLNVKKMSSFGTVGNTKYWLFIPVANIFYGFFLGIQYSKNINNLLATNSIFADPMTEEEKKKWEACPKVTTALSMMMEKEREEEQKENHEE